MICRVSYNESKPTIPVSFTHAGDSALMIRCALRVLFHSKFYDKEATQQSHTIHCFEVTNSESLLVL